MLDIGRGGGKPEQANVSGHTKHYTTGAIKHFDYWESVHSSQLVFQGWNGYGSSR